MLNPKTAGVVHVRRRRPSGDAEYEFTADWFSGHVRFWDGLMEQLKPSRILEIGSYEGRSTCYLIEKCSQVGRLEIYCVDTWAGGVEHERRREQQLRLQ